jgi:hypothetical protein
LAATYQQDIKHQRYYWRALQKFVALLIQIPGHRKCYQCTFIWSMATDP